MYKYIYTQSCTIMHAIIYKHACNRLQICTQLFTNMREIMYKHACNHVQIYIHALTYSYARNHVQVRENDTALVFIILVAIKR